MKQLTRQEKLKEVCIEALKEYSISYNQVEFFTEDTNVFFKICTDNDLFMLKICQEESSTIEDSIAEVFFLKYIDQNTPITIPKIIPSKNKDDIVLIKTPHFEQEKRIILYSFMEGDDFYSRETDELFEKLGETTAVLHNACERMKLPSHIKPRKWDTVFYFRDEPIVYNDEKYKDFTLEEDRLFLDKFIPYLNKELMSYYDRQTFIIHADLNPMNIKVHNGEIRLLDFEDAIVGTEIHDFAILFFYYKYVKSVDYNTIKAQIFQGYQKHRKLPEFTEFDLDLLIMARSANFVNYALYWDDDPKSYFKKHCERMKEFVKQYKIDL